MQRLILLIILFSAISSCKKEGCTDSNAINFDSNAEVNNGLCEYEAISDTLLPQISIHSPNGGITNLTIFQEGEILDINISISDDLQLQEVHSQITCEANDSIYWLNAQTGMKESFKQITSAWTASLPQGVNSSGFILSVNATDASNNTNSQLFSFTVVE
jgi:hypothetical protein